MHPLHPVLVHAPIVAFVLTPVTDAAALLSPAGDFFFQVSATLAGLGVGVGGLAALAGAMDYERARSRAPKLVLSHALLMGSAWTLALVSLIGRLGPDWLALLPPPLWAILASSFTLIATLAGAWCGGELVFGHGVNVRAADPARDPSLRE